MGRLPRSDGGHRQLVLLTHLVEVESDLARIEIFVDLVLTSRSSRLDLIFFSTLTSSLGVPFLFILKLLLNN